MFKYHVILNASTQKPEKLKHMTHILLDPSQLPEDLSLTCFKVLKKDLSGLGYDSSM